MRREAPRSSSAILLATFGSNATEKNKNLRLATPMMMMTMMTSEWTLLPGVLGGEEDEAQPLQGVDRLVTELLRLDGFG